MSTLSPGHRVVPYTADCVIEAWGPDRLSCLNEAMQALVEEFADVDDEPTSEPLPIGADAGDPEEVLLALLENVIYTIDVFSVVPVRFHLEDSDDGGVAGDMEVIPASKVKMTGPAPKAVSYHGLSMPEGKRGWRCRAALDV